MLGDLQALLLADFSVNEFTVALESAHDIQFGASRWLFSSPDSPPVNHYAGTVETRHGYDRAGHVLVASGQRNDTIIPLGAHGGLDGVGDEVPRLQTVPHACCAHGYAVGDSDGVEAVADHVRIDDPRFHAHRKIEEMHVARVALIPDRADPHLGFFHIFSFEAGGVEHGLGGALGFRLRQDRRKFVHLFHHTIVSHHTKGRSADPVATPTGAHAESRPPSTEGTSFSGCKGTRCRENTY
mmetsp:Transcript_1409/g.3036  ORF Transcript_1409/g.3036 Transcript_1409/m.3036 type:complete len:240 (+) Transcript_1409:1659-2378(+)